MQLGNFLVENREFKRKCIDTITRNNIYPEENPPSENYVALARDLHELRTFLSAFLTNYSNRAIAKFTKLHRYFL